MKALLSLATPNRALMMSFFWSRLGARPNPLANWKHAIFTTGSSVIRKRSDPVFGGLVSTSRPVFKNSDRASTPGYRGPGAFVGTNKRAS